MGGVTAGLAHVRGDAVVIDVRRPPRPSRDDRVLPEKWAEGYEDVCMVVTERQSTGQSDASTPTLFYWLIWEPTDGRTPKNASEFRPVTTGASTSST